MKELWSDRDKKKTKGDMNGQRDDNRKNGIMTDRELKRGRIELWQTARWEGKEWRTKQTDRDIWEGKEQMPIYIQTEIYEKGMNRDI